MDDLHTAYADARRAYRAAWFAYQAASGPDFLPAMDAWIAADREVKRLQALLATAQQAA
jgi:hypothetical protein